MTSLAVLDLGKTNSKMFVFSHDGNVIDQHRTAPKWNKINGLSVLDDAALTDWVRTVLAQSIAQHDVSRLIVSGHGCTFALVGQGKLLHPILDYEQEIPDEIAAEIDPLLPDFSETFTPLLPLGFCWARHLYWLVHNHPDLFDKTEAILNYPQYWSWLLTGKAVGEWSYIGAHSQLWAPLKRDFSSLVDRMGWREKFPAIVEAGAEIGEVEIAMPDGGTRSVIVHNGMHDSNAALAFYRMTGLSDFTLVSTGTWVIIFNLDCPLDALDPERDMISNVTVKGEPAPALRFMGGREYDLISDGWKRPISVQAIETVIAERRFAMPSWAAGGPFPDNSGEIVGGEVTGEARAAVALLYVTMMTDLSLDLIHSTNTLVIDGGLAKVDLFGGMLAQLRPNQPVLRSAMNEGSAIGAAAIAFDALGRRPFADETTQVPASAIAGLAEYRATWRQMAEERRGLTA